MIWHTDIQRDKSDLAQPGSIDAWVNEANRRTVQH